jgi:hypothetical protein
VFGIGSLRLGPGISVFGHDDTCVDICGSRTRSAQNMCTPSTRYQIRDEGIDDHECTWRAGEREKSVIWMVGLVVAGCGGDWAFASLNGALVCILRRVIRMVAFTLAVWGCMVTNVAMCVT